MEITREEKIKIMVERISTQVFSSTSIRSKMVNPNKLAEILIDILEFMEKSNNTK